MDKYEEKEKKTTSYSIYECFASVAQHFGQIEIRLGSEMELFFLFWIISIMSINNVL